MRRLAAVTSALALAVAVGACDIVEPSGAAPTDAPTNGTVATVPTATLPTVVGTFDPDVTVPDAGGSRLGCVDEEGSIRAPAAAWYHSGAAGELAFTGEFVTTEKFVKFTNAVDDAVGRHVDSFTAEGASELARDASSCVSYRYVQFQRDDEATIVVAVWRVEGATDPYWVPNERQFVRRDDATLVSDGEHIRVALVVGGDGTTARVSAYGRNAVDLVAGWPSTITIAADRLPGPAPAAVEELIAIGNDVLRYSLDR